MDTIAQRSIPLLAECLKDDIPNIKCTGSYLADDTECWTHNLNVSDPAMRQFGLHSLQLCCETQGVDWLRLFTLILIRDDRSQLEAMIRALNATKRDSSPRYSRLEFQDGADMSYVRRFAYIGFGAISPQEPVFTRAAKALIKTALTDFFKEHFDDIRFIAPYAPSLAPYSGKE